MLTNLFLKREQEVLDHYRRPSASHQIGRACVCAHIWCMSVKDHLLLGVCSSLVNEKNPPNIAIPQPAQVRQMQLRDFEDHDSMLWGTSYLMRA